jgi:hypothetical protein
MGMAGAETRVFGTERRMKTHGMVLLVSTQQFRIRFEGDLRARSVAHFVFLRR